jgi:hypothetical protein
MPQSKASASCRDTPFTFGELGRPFRLKRSGKANGFPLMTHHAFSFERCTLLDDQPRRIHFSLHD